MSRTREVSLRHFGGLGPEQVERLFGIPPARVTQGQGRAHLAEALGGTLYTPATRPHLVQDVERAAASGVTSVVLDLEDSVQDQSVRTAMANVADALVELDSRWAAGPIPIALFVRVRHHHTIAQVLGELGDGLSVLTGVVIPKFGARDAALCLDAVAAAAPDLLVMPVLETAEFLQADVRLTFLKALGEELLPYRERILVVRVGGTDLAGLYGLRRTPDLTIYDVQLMAAALGDIVNLLGRPEQGYPISGPVWEHFAPRARVLRPQLRASPFVEHAAEDLRAGLMVKSYDGLVREALLDRANGMTGKSVIHPDQAAIVNALSVVTDEEFADASQITAVGSSGGALGSAYRNKMNETRPHAVWAQRTLRRAEVFGVARPGLSYVDILAAGEHER